jgi:predicted NBD/HSP70 family sugar kinase
MACTRSIGVVITDHAALGVVRPDHTVGDIVRFPPPSQTDDTLYGIPAEEMIAMLADEIKALAEGEKSVAVGLAFPGIIRAGIIEDSPNLHQLKGLNMAGAMRAALEKRGIEPVLAILNDADAAAAGIAASHGRLDELVRVWTLGHGIGFGHYPVADGVWEGGHTTISLDSNERFCACGGLGHLEGIMGHRAMRLRFLDREPEEVFEAARLGEDPRCSEFVLLWHRALAAATASEIHIEGAGKFYITGLNARFVNVALLNRYIQDMVKMSPLQGYVFEVIPRSDELAVIGAAVTAERAA